MTSRIPQIGNTHTFVGQDIRSLIELRRDLNGDKPFMIWEPFTGEGKTWSYAAFANQVARFAAGLHRRGVKSGERVLVLLDNCPEAVFAWFGCAYAGAVAVTTNARSSGDELSYYCDHSGAVAAITQPKFAELVAEACKGVSWIAVTDTDNGDEPLSRPSTDASFWRIDADPADLPARPRDPLAPFSIQFTSGTTSRPKAVLWTHANALWGGKICALHEDLRASDIHLVTMPLFHTNAQCYSVLATLWAGGTCVVQPRFSASRFWPTSLKHGCTWTSMVPFCVRALMQHEVPKHSYRWWGSAVCDPPTDAHFNVRSLGWWGMTETITHGIVGNIHLPNRSMSMGRVAPEYEISVRDDDGKDVRPGETGSLFIRGVPKLSLFAEYFGNEKATRESFTDDGYFITGDLVMLADDGFLIFADRAKDMLKVGGENVAASEIERVILTVPGIAEVAVVARKHEMLDEVPVAFILPAGGKDAAAPGLGDTVLAACTKALASFKHPREVRIVDSFPRATLEKIAKNELRKMLADESARG
ncbi:putative sulfoacetate--CoA ligase [Variibacter gotjawalensis]|uniref:Putative sulfoacetate--CoA ligase n=1 Tax=Variibacter gotjawalensis TaxID=1333996 RepID=A0A0S3PXR0_9BRAD|nr:crotonobetaine/carnitine-CoA ligase [Variibacter gotjawalensis]RZS48441.1 crotonobetaine/carnitine-CoA ligase [Variibacter gotjawalensis]BAT60702.1 putative sulfoacetate--CoA ligase [Variibacter gotjawalensis]